MALAIAGGAWLPVSIPLLPVVILGLVALFGRRQRMLIVALLLISSAHSAREWCALDEPLPLEASGVAVLVADPEPTDHADRAVVTFQQRRYELWASRSVSGFSELRAGHRLEMTGVVKPLSGPRTAGLRRKHVAGTITLHRMTALPSTDLAATVPNGLRVVLERGAHAMNERDRALYTGLVYGDDRLQTDEVKDQFRDSGLAHLTAVSGANVAFVLLLLAPLLRRFQLAGRFAGGMLVLLVFGALTRWEPSVVRAEFMAAVVMYGAFIGRPVPLVRCIALAVSACVLVDPFLVGSLGFLLSVVACMGMAALGNLLSAVVPGASAFRRVVAFSAAAQIAVAPLQLLVFGSVPLVGLTTNVLADPVAGCVMIWGVPAGLLAGVVGGGAAAILHLPTELMLRWIQLVAEGGAYAERDAALRLLIFLLPLLGLFSWKRRSTVVGVDVSHPPSSVDES
jgi:competence protein ComEC